LLFPKKTHILVIEQTAQEVRMNLEIKGVHYDLSKTTKEFIGKKLEKIDFAKDYIIELHISITKEKPGYTVEANVHFRWGHTSHAKAAPNHELYEGIEQMIDKLEHIVRKEKDKMKEHPKEHTKSNEIPEDVIE
jgi:putative sigma-54 modulation protein